MNWIRESASPDGSPFPRWTELAIVFGSIATGIAIFALCTTPSDLALGVAAIGFLAILLIYPEMALALYVVVGDVKGDDRIADLLPVDFTLLLGAVLIAGMALNFLRKRQPVEMPASYLLFIVLIGMMAASLSYTPVFAAGLEKLVRFLTVTGIVIVAPFAVLDTPRAFKRFLGVFAVAALGICAWSLTNLGGDERLATPSNNTIGLGHIACALIFLIWFAVIARNSLPYRILAYFLLAVPALALIGSGSRGPAIACGAVIFISALFLRRLRIDLACIALLGLAILPFVGIPKASLSYLGSLTDSPDVSTLLGFRSDLLAQAWRLMEQHPFTGIGIQGFAYASPNPALYNWPHNIFLEMASELGIFAALIGIAIFVCSLWESMRQLRDPHAPFAMLSQLAAALLVSGIINATNTGDINSDRSTWLFVSLVFVLRGLTLSRAERSSGSREIEYREAAFAAPARL